MILWGARLARAVRLARYRGGYHMTQGGEPIPQQVPTDGMNEARLSHLPFWGPSEGFFLMNSKAVGLTRM